MWSSSDESIAIIDQKGIVELVGEGTCTITVDVAGIKAETICRSK